jgi:hypothetical protein
MSNHLYHTAELRWFVPAGNRWDRMLLWFALAGQLQVRNEGTYDPAEPHGPFVKVEQERTDLYLLLPGTSTASVKQRQGRLEVKALVAGPHPFYLETLAGQVDQWVKWTFQPSPAIAAPLEAELGQTGPWREVAKKRYLQQVVFDTGRPVAVSPDLCPGAGCHVELTLVNLIETFSAWFTVGFEAFGPPDQALALLDAAVRHFFATHGSPPVQLDSRASLSYPAWLATLP